MATDVEAARGVLEDDEVARARDERPWPGDVVTHDVSVGEYVGTRLGAAVVDRLVEPLLGGVYAGHASRLSLRATMPALWARQTAPVPRPGAFSGRPLSSLRGVLYAADRDGL